MLRINVTGVTMITNGAALAFNYTFISFKLSRNPRIFTAWTRDFLGAVSVPTEKVANRLAKNPVGAGVLIAPASRFQDVSWRKKKGGKERKSYERSCPPVCIRPRTFGRNKCRQSWTGNGTKVKEPVENCERSASLMQKKQVDENSRA